MDPITQGILGAALPQVIASKEDVRGAALIGALAGMAPDLDVLIRSSTDPILALQFHRHFTHSLVFIPLGSLIVAGLLYGFWKNRLSWKRTYLYALLGFATHAPLDACTSYGTQLLWPFDGYRVAWDNIAVIDPLFTLPLALFAATCYFRHRPRWAGIGLLWALVYLLFGVVQRERAKSILEEVIVDRGQEAVRVAVKPSLGNLILWRGIYESEGRFYVDGIRVGLFSKPKVYPGDSLDRFSVSKTFPHLEPNSVQAGDIRRFLHFSDHYTVLHPEYQDVVGDLRYGFLPHDIRPIWGITVDPGEPGRHCAFQNFPMGKGGAPQLFIRMLRGHSIDGPP